MDRCSKHLAWHFLTVVIALALQQRARATVSYASELTVQVIYVSSYSGVPVSDITSYVRKNLAVARTAFSQIGVRLNILPLRVDAIEIPDPSSWLTLAHLWQQDDFEQLRKADPFRDGYRVLKQVPVYIVKDYDGYLGSGSDATTLAPYQAPSSANPLDYPAIILDRYASYSTLAHELGHFLLDGAHFTSRVAPSGDDKHLADGMALMSQMNRLEPDNPENYSQYAPMGTFGQIGFDPVSVPSASGPFLANQVWAMNHRGKKSGYLTHLANNTGNYLVSVGTSIDTVGQSYRQLSDSIPHQLSLTDPVAGTLRAFSTVPGDPINGQQFPYTIHQSVRRVNGGFLEINYQLDFETPYSFAFQGGVDGVLSILGVFSPNTPGSPQASWELLYGAATLVDATVCIDAICDTPRSAVVESFADPAYAGVPRSAFNYQLHFRNGSIVDAEALQWTIRVQAGFQPLVAGDFNNDGTLDAADYVSWRKGLGTIYTQADYANWQANFGLGELSIGGGGSATRLFGVPEPSNLFLLLTAAMLPLRCRRRFRT